MSFIIGLLMVLLSVETEVIVHFLHTTTQSLLLLVQRQSYITNILLQFALQLKQLHGNGLYLLW